jgi:hypothetical protein
MNQKLCVKVHDDSSKRHVSRPMWVLKMGRSVAYHSIQIEQMQCRHSGSWNSSGQETVAPLC